jgi:outer membrane protein assembly factor BamB
MRGALLAAGALCLVLAVGIVLLANGSSVQQSFAFTGWGYPNVNLSNTRDVSGPIDGASVSSLGVAWTLPITGQGPYGSYASTPVISDGVVYSQDLASNVQAIDLQTGRVLWTTSFESPDQGPNGLVVAGGRVYGATSTSAFSLDEQTGGKVWSVTLVRNAKEGIDMAPGYHNGIVYVSTVPGNASQFYTGEGVGVLWALDGTTGRTLWRFDTAPPGLWGHPSVNSGGGLWYPPAFDEQGFMYFGVGNPAPFPGTSRYPWGSSRPGPNLYTDSLVKLNAQTGKLQWYYQLTPHDLYDWDLQDPPILVNEDGRQLVVEAGKAGIVLGIDSESGKLLWRRSVGIHNGHDQDSVHAMRHEYSKLKSQETVYPGTLGGVIAPMAASGSTVFVPVVNLPVTLSEQTVTQEGPNMTGELVAIDVATGSVKWDSKFPSAAFAAATAVNELVFVPTLDGTLYALDANTGNIVWKTKLPAGTISGVSVNGDTLIAGAGKPLASGQATNLVAYRINEGDK